jgi:hypothetical protein
MKTILRFLLLLSLLFTAALADSASTARTWAGAWRGTDGATERVLLIVDGYFTHTSFERAKPQFHRTFGGPLEFQAAGATALIHFDSAEPARVGQAVALSGERVGTELRLRQGDGEEEIWRRIDESPGALTGVWRISGRQRDGQIQPMPLAARRTLKVLGGSRFQWIAMNIETGEFSGTGGGRYGFVDGVYTEVIEFFSRDASRVGAKLEFQGSVRDGNWHHQGLSSRGDPIYEIWSKLAPVR